MAAGAEEKLIGRITHYFPQCQHYPSHTARADQNTLGLLLFYEFDIIQLETAIKYTTLRPIESE